MPLLPYLLLAAAPFQSTNSAALGDHLRYEPQDGAFVRIHGYERFNRPLYGGNTAFRVDGGDIPEFVLYLPGRGGNIRFALQRGDAIKWIHEADSVESRYDPGSLSYRIQDTLLEGGVLHLTALASYDAEGFLARCVVQDGPADLRIVAVYGGLNGERGKRGGDIGTEAVPISEWFQLKPEFCRDNRFTLNEPEQSFLLRGPKCAIGGTVSQSATLRVVDAAAWADPQALLTADVSTATALPLVAIFARPEADQPLVFGWRNRPDSAPEERENEALSETAPNWNPAGLVAQFERDEAARLDRAGKLSTQTPDPYLDTAVAALCIGSDATWDEPQHVVMHGAIAWRSKLLGWRGPYAMDTLGWHERARHHLAYWARQQDVSPIPERIPGPDEDANLARSEAALHSNGALSRSHYDMNLVYIDALFRHLRWTGDVAFGKSVWPVIARHLDWERRLFRRAYESDGVELPLYEAYAAIWASDEMSYNGGGVAYTSAYNAFHNREAAKLAALIGEDPEPYRAEADLIERAMRELLWTNDGGVSRFAEYKDWMGLRRVHPAAGLWSVYHVIDSEVSTPMEAYQMTRYVERRIPSRRIDFPELRDPRPLWVYASSHWFPYDWSVNNVVMGENLHTALAFWQAGRSEEAWSLAKGSILASMFAGICPGNVGSMNYLDAYRGESQRDFADGSGVMSRAIVEGLFGIQPDLLRQRFVLRPGFPSDWQRASISHESIDLEYRRSSGDAASITVDARFPQPAQLVLRLPLATVPASIRINHAEPRSIRKIEDSGHGYLEAVGPAGLRFEIEYAPAAAAAAANPPAFEYTPAAATESINWSKPVSSSRTRPIDLSAVLNAEVTEIFEQEYRSPRSPFVSLAIPKQGIGGWAGGYKRTYAVDDTGLRAAAAGLSGRIHLPNAVPLLTPHNADQPNIAFVSLWDNYPDRLAFPVAGRARRAYALMAGSTNWMQSHIDNGVLVFHYDDGSSSELALRNPDTWWPIDQDYYVGNFQFQHPGPYPLRLDLATGRFREFDSATGPMEAKAIAGGAAIVLVHPLDPSKDLVRVELRALSTEVVIGLMALTLEAPE